MLFHQIPDVLFGEVLIKDAVRLDHQNRTVYTQSAGACLNDPNVIFEFPVRQFRFEGVFYFERTIGDAVGTCTNHYMQTMSHITSLLMLLIRPGPCVVSAHYLLIAKT